MRERMNQEGFTLIEVIAVVVVFGIIAAVTVPQYINMQEEARITAAHSCIAEVKAQCTQYYAILLLRNGTPSLVFPASILASVGAVPNVGADFTVKAAVNASNIEIAVSQVKGVPLSTVATSTWYYPTY